MLLNFGNFVLVAPLGVLLHPLLPHYVRRRFLRFIFELVCSLCRLALEVLGYVVNLSLVLEEDGADDPRVYLDGTVRRSWSHAPHQEGTLSHVVKWEPGQEDVSKELCHAEHPIHHPVGQPFCVIIFGYTLNGFDRYVGWISKSDEVAQ